MNIRCFATLLGGLLLAAPGIANASDPQQLAPLVVTATMTEQPLNSATGTIQVITHEQIVQLAAEDVADVLRHAAGINVMTGTGRSREASIRGMGGGHTLILLDGRRITGGYNAIVDLKQIPVLLIDHIEIVRGPGSALYGSEAAGGVINIITSQPPQQTEAAVDARGGVGLAAEQSLQGQVGTAAGPLRATIAAAHGKQDGWDDAAEAGQEVDDTQLDTVYTRAAVDLAPGQVLSLGGEWGEFQRDGQRYYMNAERKRAGDEKRIGGYLQYELAADTPYRAMVRVYGNQSKGSYQFSPTAPSGNADENQRELLQLETRGSYQVVNGLTLTAGGELRWETLEGDQLSSYDDDHKSDQIKAMYGQFDWSPNAWLNLVGSLRFDDYANSGSQVTPRLVASVFIPSGKLWAGYGQGFRAATLDELYGQVYRRQGKDLYLGNEDLDPETSDSFEAGAELHNQRVRGQLVYFHNRVEDLIDLVQISTSGNSRTYEYQNVNKATTYGLELETGLTLSRRLDLSVQGTWLQTENKDTGKDLAGEPEWKGEVAVTWQVPLVEIESQLRYLYFGNCEDGSGGKLDGYDLVSLYLSKQLTDSLKVYAGSDNLFQEENDYFIQDPLQVYAGINYRF